MVFVIFETEQRVSGTAVTTPGWGISDLARHRRSGGLQLLTSRFLAGEAGGVTPEQGDH